MLDLRIVIENSAKEPSDQHKTHARMHFPYIHTHNKRNTISNCCNSIEYIYVVHGQKIPLRCCALTIQISSHYRCCKCEQRERKNDKKKSSGGILPCPFVHFITYRTNTAFTSYNRHMAYSAMHPLL